MNDASGTAVTKVTPRFTMNEVTRAHHEVLLAVRERGPVTPGPTMAEVRCWGWVEVRPLESPVHGLTPLGERELRRLQARWRR